MESTVLGITHKKEIEEAQARTPSLVSELNFTNLFVWRVPHTHRVQCFKGHCLVSFVKEGKTCFYQPLGPDPASIITEMVGRDPTTVFCRVHRDIALQVPGVSYSADRDNFDYVYARGALVGLEGGPFESFRRHVRTFEKNRPTVRSLTEETVSDCEVVQRYWCEEQQGCEDADMLALKEAITHFSELSIGGVVVYVDSEPVAFAIGETIGKVMFVEHFEKSKPLRGAYQYVLHQLAKTLPERVEYINREQDLGIERLREAKLRSKPSYLIEKYTLWKG